MIGFLWTEVKHNNKKNTIIDIVLFRIYSLVIILWTNVIACKYNVDEQRSRSTNLEAKMSGLIYTHSRAASTVIFFKQKSF